jgi:hypothetical protein
VSEWVVGFESAVEESKEGGRERQRKILDHCIQLQSIISI